MLRLATTASPPDGLERIATWNSATVLSTDFDEVWRRSGKALVATPTPRLGVCERLGAGHGGMRIW
ncbi:MAG: hypothetical protein JO100_03740 [Pseudonocardia sp.]|nr:hypothetical protein [Pseudonocardia sp.]